MGGGRWSDDVYASVVSDRATMKVDTFDYHSKVASGVAPPVVHTTLDPKKIAASVTGKREARDSVEHPNSTPVICMLDVTGSMGEVPPMIQKALPKLLGLLTRKNYLEDPQICFGCVGDAYSDKYPLQVGQFESDIRIETDLTNMILEGGGGGTQQESYEMAFYFAARKTVSDAWEKRGKKGYMFITGDEGIYGTVSKTKVKEIFGDDLQADIPLKDIVEEAKERYHIFVIKPKGSSYDNDTKIVKQWKDLLGGENYLKLEDPNAICELIGLHIGLIEGTTDIDTAAKDMVDAGSSTALVTAATAAVHDTYRNRGAISRVSPGSIKPSGGSNVGRL